MSVRWKDPAVGPPSGTGDRTADAWEAYRARVAALQAAYDALPPGTPVRLAKKTSNLFRPRAATRVPGLDVAAFDGVIEIDPVARTADVQGMTTYEHLVDATLPFGLMPLVVPELKTITLGGAVTGLGIESSSWRNGMPHESVLEFDVLTGSGEVLTVGPAGEHADLFAGFPNSYGTLGYALRLKIELEPTRPYVHLRHLRFDSIAELVPVLEAVCRDGVWEGEAVAFVDGTVFGRDELYLTLGSWAGSAPFASDYTRSGIYYRSIQARTEDYLTVRDYLWRWDTDWFWCSRAFGVQRPWVRRLLGPGVLRSDTYWRILHLEERFGVKARLDRWRGLPERESVVQDVEIPVGHLAEFVDGFIETIPISPFWLCPLQIRRPGARSDLYPLDPSELYVNVGFWSTVPLAAGKDRAWHNRWVEDEVDRLDGRKSLYSTAFYTEERFWELYNGPAYRKLKDRYDPDGRLLDLYAKCVQSR
ncbi:MAG: FAD-binding oxidoreductase [Acidimicrobiaceae bacterium]|nr:FAD-binding oxidoreductase [Acidimicrobiaceae bacterium]